MHTTIERNRPVATVGHRTWEIKRLFSNPSRQLKLGKGLEYGWYTLGLPLAPAKTAGIQTCGHDTPGCRRGCIFTAGHGFYPMVQAGRIARTLLLNQHKDWFVRKLHSEIGKEVIRSHRLRLKLCVRLNTFSDRPWERMAPSLFADYEDVQFYDYTKNPVRMMKFLAGNWPCNYHLTFSRSEKNEDVCKEVLKSGGNVAVCFRHEPPAEYWGYRVINGDQHDLRFLDDTNVIVGLKAKGKAKNDRTGFTVDI